LSFQNPADPEIQGLLEKARTIAVVGLSPRPERPSHRIARRLQDWGYRIIPVRPGLDSVLGERAYPSLREVPMPVDLVDVFRAASLVDAVVDDCIERHLPALWIQLGIINEPAAERARAAGIFTVMDRCISVEYRKLLGK